MHWLSTVDLLVVPFRVKEVNSTTVRPDHRAFVVMTFSLQKLERLVKSFRGYFKSLVGNAVLLKSVAIERARTLKSTTSASPHVSRVSRAPDSPIRAATLMPRTLV